MNPSELTVISEAPERESVTDRLQQCGAKFTNTELRLPDNLSEESWAEIGRKLLRADQVMQWWIGDWATFGAGDNRQEGWRKKGALKEFCELNGFNYGTVLNKSYVSGNVHLSLRRESLPWSIYAEVAPLKPKEQKTWIERASKEKLSVSNLRREIRLANGDFSALADEGQSIELGSSHYDDLVAWLDRRPADFWTENRKKIWRERLAWFTQFAGQKLEAGAEA